MILQRVFTCTRRGLGSARRTKISNRTLAEPGGRNNLNDGRNGGLVHGRDKPLICMPRRGRPPADGVSGAPYTTRRAPERSKNRLVETGMTTFDEREKAYEKKFALDQDLKFRSEARRNKMLAEWAGSQARHHRRGARGLRQGGAQGRPRREGRRRRLPQGEARTSPTRASPSTDAEIRKAMGEFLAKAVHEVEASGKG